MKTNIVNNKPINVEITPLQYDLGLCTAHPDKLYVFGDNMTRMGNAGQACIRGAKNSVGIITKRFPSNKGDKPYMNDDNYLEDGIAISKSISDTIQMYHSGNYNALVFSHNPLGSGYASMKTRCPNLFAFLNTELRLKFGLYIKDGQYTMNQN